MWITQNRDNQDQAIKPHRCSRRLRLKSTTQSNQHKRHTEIMTKRSRQSCSLQLHDTSGQGWGERGPRRTRHYVDVSSNVTLDEFGFVGFILEVVFPLGSCFCCAGIGVSITPGVASLVVTATIVVVRWNTACLCYAVSFGGRTLCDVATIHIGARDVFVVVCGMGMDHMCTADGAGSARAGDWRRCTCIRSNVALSSVVFLLE